MFYAFDVFTVGMLLGFLALVVVMGFYAIWKLFTGGKI